MRDKHTIDTDQPNSSTIEIIDLIRKVSRPKLIRIAGTFGCDQMHVAWNSGKKVFGNKIIKLAVVLMMEERCY